MTKQQRLIRSTDNALRTNTKTIMIIIIENYKAIITNGKQMLMD